jgi:alpha-L-rhamnosidase
MVLTLVIITGHEGNWQIFGGPPDHLGCRAPGKVNLTGIVPNPFQRYKFLVVLAVWLVLFPAFSDDTGPVSPANLRTEYLSNPLGIDAASPRLSWIVESGRRGAHQVAYRVLVASSRDNLRKGVGDLWDSGIVDSDQTTQLAYAGKPLATSERAYWTVTTWGDKGGRPMKSAVAWWEMGVLNASDWHAGWIGTPGTPPVDKRPAPYLGKEFSIGKQIRRARVYASAKGLYRLFVNGQQVGKDYFTPGWTDYRKRIQYQTFDATSALKSGTNRLGMVLGNGWYCGHVGWTAGNNYGVKPMGLCQLDIEYTDGTTQEVVSDGSWKAGSGAIRSDDLLMGETCDARMSWDDKAAIPVDVQPIGEVPLVAQHSPAVQVLTEIHPKSISQPKPDVYVYDLGQNMVGFARLKVQGQAGETVQLRFAEMLNPDGTVYTTNLRGAKATDRYTLRGGDKETYEPSFTFHGFRYVEVTGYPGVPDLNAITGVVLGSNNPQTGTFACSNPLVNQLQHNIYWGERGNYLSVATDCPQRDERLGWMGDGEIFAPTACYNNDVASFLTKWTQDMVDAQSADGGFPDVSPRIVDQSDGAPAWGDAGVIVPWSVYEAYGDRRLLDERYPAMKAWVDYIDSANPDHIWINRSNNNFGDWLNVNDPTPADVLATAYFARSTDLVARTAQILSKTEDADKYGHLEDEIKAAFVEKFVSSDGHIKGDSQTCYVLALAFNLLSDSQREQAGQYLIQHIADRKNHLSTGFVGVGALNPTLTAIGRPDIAYKLLTNDTYPSWGFSIRQGATTIWERWDGWTPDKGFQDPGMNSFNHYSLGSVGNWMYSTVAGIALDPDAPGYRHIVFHPIPGGGLTWAKGALDSPHGRIESEWHLAGRRFTLDITVPANTTATVYIPAARPEGVSGSAGAMGAREENGYAVFEVTSGHYSFSSMK